MNILKWLNAVWSYEFGGWDYRKHQCKAMKKGMYCCRARYHPGQHRDNSGRKWA